MKRKRSFLRVTALLMSSLLLLAFGGCGKKNTTSNAGLKLTADCLSEIGKTFDLIKEENPNVEYQSVLIPDASGECLGQAGDSFFYFFFGTQDFPGLMDLGTEYGDKLKCAGIVSTVGEIYPDVTEEMPLEQFFSDCHIAEYTYYLEENPAQGWIEFSHEGYHVWLDTRSGVAKAANMDSDWIILITDKEIARENYAIRDAYWKRYLELELQK